MAKSDRFVWHPAARLFAGAQEIPHSCAVATSFQSIAAQPTDQAIAGLVSAIQSRVSFCISETPLTLHASEDRFITLSAGSSGKPKLIQRKQRSWIESFHVNGDQFAYRSGDAVAVLGTLSHSLSLYGVVEALHLGLDAHLLNDLAPTHQVDHIRVHKVSVLYLTPSQLRLIVRGTRSPPLPNVRLILCGGGTLDPQTKESAQALCPNAKIRVFYGAAETSFVTLADEHTPNGSVGQPFPGVEIKLLDQANNETSDVGEVWVKSPYLFEGYLDGASAQTQWQNGFVTVGEFGRFDQQGNLWLEGRRSRMVTIADHNVFPEAVEACIATLDGIGACAVVALQDTLRGHRLVAVIEGLEDVKIARTVRQICLETLGPLRTPKAILFCPALPYLPSGKVDLKSLTKWVKEHV